MNRIIDFNHPSSIDKVASGATRATLKKMSALLVQYPLDDYLKIPPWLASEYGARNVVVSGSFVKDIPPTRSISFVLNGTQYQGTFVGGQITLA